MCARYRAFGANRVRAVRRATMSAMFAHAPRTRVSIWLLCFVCVNVCWDGASIAVRTLEHRPIGTVCDGEHMRRHLVALYALVPLHDFLGVDGQLGVRIDHHTEETGICLREVREK